MNSEVSIQNSTQVVETFSRSKDTVEVNYPKYNKLRRVIAAGIFGISLSVVGYLPALAQEKPPLVISGSPLPNPNHEESTDDQQASEERPKSEEIEDEEGKVYDLSQYGSPLKGTWQITQGPSVRTINGEVCGPDDHVSHHGLAQYSIDVLTPSGIPVFAVQEGTVIQAGWIPQYGDAVRIQHPDELVSWYGHLSQMNVNVGDTLQKGDFIGQTGKTGTADDHLHFEIRDKTNSSISLDGMPSIGFYWGADDSCTAEFRFEGEVQDLNTWRPSLYEGSQNPGELAQSTVTASKAP